MAGQRETVPLSPLDHRHQYRHLFSPGILREEPQTQDSSHIDSPHPDVNQECPSKDDRETESVNESVNEVNEVSEVNKVNEDTIKTKISPSSPPSSPREEPVKNIVERYRAVQLCTAGPPHCCRAPATEEERKQLSEWEEKCWDQLSVGETLRSDIKRDENGKYPLSFMCSLLSEYRKTQTKTTATKIQNHLKQSKQLAESKKTVVKE